MKRIVVIAGTLFLAAAAVGAVVFTMNSAASPAAPNATRAAAHASEHDHDHAGHTHGPNGECPLDAATAVGVEEPAAKDGIKPVPAVAPTRPGA